jgi:hypothetical protein
VRTTAQRSLLSLVFALIVTFAPLCRGVEQSPAQEHPLQPVYRELDALFHHYNPNATSEALNGAIHFEYNTRVFLVHEPLKTGEWQDATGVRGPNGGGIRCDIELRKGRYLGAAAVPQTFDKRYFKLWVAAPYSVSRDQHLYVHLYYPANVRAEFLETFSRVVEGFAK